MLWLKHAENGLLKDEWCVMISWLIIGPTPPPLGGVTVFIKRFITLRNRRGSQVYNAYPNSLRSAIATLSIAFKRPNNVMVNSMRWPLLLLIALLFPFSKKIIVDHNHSRSFMAWSNTNNRKIKITWWITKQLLNHYDRIWIVAEHLRDNYQNLGIDTKLSIINPFIAPDETEYNDALNQYNPKLRVLLSSKKSSPLFAISAYKLMKENGRDLYGFDIALKALRIVNDKGYNAKLIIFVADPVRTPEYDNAKSLIASLSLHDHIIWEEGQKPLWPIFKSINAYLRPTLTDGWSVSIGESLAFQCPVIASDVVKRDSRCALFKYPETISLAKQMELLCGV